MLNVAMAIAFLPFFYALKVLNKGNIFTSSDSGGLKYNRYKVRVKLINVHLYQ